MNIPPKVSIVILNWNGLKDTIECLESLKKITYQNYKVIVVDNGSKNNEGKILKEKFGDYIYLIQNSKNLGFTEGNNVAIKQILKEGESKYILLLNNDTFVDSDFLNELINVCEKSEEVGAAGPDIRLFSNKKRPQIDEFGKIHQVCAVDTLSGACLLIKTDVLRKIGLLDPIYFSYAEDHDINKRIQKALYKVVYVPTKAKVYHKLETSTKNFPSMKVYYMVRNDFLIIRRYYKGLNKIQFFLRESQPARWLKEIVIRKKIELIPAYLKGLIAGIVLYIQNPPTPSSPLNKKSD